MKSEIEQTIEIYFEFLRNLPNVLNVAVGKKIVDGKPTDQECIVVYVSKKVSEKLLTVNTAVPKIVGNICTDVVELSSPDFKMGRTHISELPWEIQKRLAGGVK